MQLEELAFLDFLVEIEYGRFQDDRRTRLEKLVRDNFAILLKRFKETGQLMPRTEIRALLKKQYDMLFPCIKEKFEEWLGAQGVECAYEEIEEEPFVLEEPAVEIPELLEEAVNLVLEKKIAPFLSRPDNQPQPNLMMIKFKYPSSKNKEIEVSALDLMWALKDLRQLTTGRIIMIREIMEKKRFVPRVKGFELDQKNAKVPINYLVRCGYFTRHTVYSDEFLNLCECGSGSASISLLNLNEFLHKRENFIPLRQIEEDLERKKFYFIGKSGEGTRISSKALAARLKNIGSRVDSDRLAKHFNGKNNIIFKFSGQSGVPFYYYAQFIQEAEFQRAIAESGKWCPWETVRGLIEQGEIKYFEGSVRKKIRLLKLKGGEDIFRYVKNIPGLSEFPFEKVRCPVRSTGLICVRDSRAQGYDFLIHPGFVKWLKEKSRKKRSVCVDEFNKRVIQLVKKGEIELPGNLSPEEIIALPWNEGEWTEPQEKIFYYAILLTKALPWIDDPEKDKLEQMIPGLMVKIFQTDIEIKAMQLMDKYGLSFFEKEMVEERGRILLRRMIHQWHLAEEGATQQTPEAALAKILNPWETPGFDVIKNVKNVIRYYLFKFLDLAARAHYSANEELVEKGIALWKQIYAERGSPPNYAEALKLLRCKHLRPCLPGIYQGLESEGMSYGDFLRKILRGKNGSEENKILHHELSRWVFDGLVKHYKETAHLMPRTEIRALLKSQYDTLFPLVKEKFEVWLRALGADCVYEDVEREPFVLEHPAVDIPEPLAGGVKLVLEKKRKGTLVPFQPRLKNQSQPKLMVIKFKDPSSKNKEIEVSALDLVWALKDLNQLTTGRIKMIRDILGMKQFVPRVKALEVDPEQVKVPIASLSRTPYFSLSLLYSDDFSDVTDDVSNIQTIFLSKLNAVFRRIDSFIPLWQIEEDLERNRFYFIGASGDPVKALVRLISPRFKSVDKNIDPGRFKRHFDGKRNIILELNNQQGTLIYYYAQFIRGAEFQRAIAKSKKWHGWKAVRGLIEQEEITYVEGTVRRMIRLLKRKILSLKTEDHIFNYVKDVPVLSEFPFEKVRCPVRSTGLICVGANGIQGHDFRLHPGFIEWLGEVSKRRRPVSVPVKKAQIERFNDKVIRLVAAGRVRLPREVGLGQIRYLPWHKSKWTRKQEEIFYKAILLMKALPKIDNPENDYLESVISNLVINIFEADIKRNAGAIIKKYGLASSERRTIEDILRGYLYNEVVNWCLVQNGNGQKEKNIVLDEEIIITPWNEPDFDIQEERSRISAGLYFAVGRYADQYFNNRKLGRNESIDVKQRDQSIEHFAFDILSGGPVLVVLLLTEAWKILAAAARKTGQAISLASGGSRWPGRFPSAGEADFFKDNLTEGISAETLGGVKYFNADKLSGSVVIGRNTLPDFFGIDRGVFPELNIQGVDRGIKGDTHLILLSEKVNEYGHNGNPILFRHENGPHLFGAVKSSVPFLVKSGIPAAFETAGTGVFPVGAADGLFDLGLVSPALGQSHPGVSAQDDHRVAHNRFNHIPQIFSSQLFVLEEFIHFLEVVIAAAARSGGPGFAGRTERSERVVKKTGQGGSFTGGTLRSLPLPAGPAMEIALAAWAARAAWALFAVFSAVAVVSAAAVWKAGKRETGAGGGRKPKGRRKDNGPWSMPAKHWQGLFTCLRDAEPDQERKIKWDALVREIPMLGSVAGQQKAVGAAAGLLKGGDASSSGLVREFLVSEVFIFGMFEQFLDSMKRKLVKEAACAVKGKRGGRSIDEDSISEAMRAALEKEQRRSGLPDPDAVIERVMSLLRIQDRSVLIRIDRDKADRFCEEYLNECRLGLFHVICAGGIFLLLERNPGALMTDMFHVRDHTYKSKIVGALGEKFISRLTEDFLFMPDYLTREGRDIKAFYEDLGGQDRVRSGVENMFRDMLFGNKYFPRKYITNEQLEQKNRLNGVLGGYLQEWSGVRILIRDHITGIDLSCVKVEYLLTLIEDARFAMGVEITYSLHRFKADLEELAHYEVVSEAGKTARGWKMSRDEEEEFERRWGELDLAGIMRECLGTLFDSDENGRLFQVDYARKIYSRIFGREIKAEDEIGFTAYIAFYLYKAGTDFSEFDSVSGSMVNVLRQLREKEGGDASSVMARSFTGAEAFYVLRVLTFLAFMLWLVAKTAGWNRAAGGALYAFPLPAGAAPEAALLVFVVFWVIAVVAMEGVAGRGDSEIEWKEQPPEEKLLYLPREHWAGLFAVLKEADGNRDRGRQWDALIKQLSAPGRPPGWKKAVSAAMKLFYKGDGTSRTMIREFLASEAFIFAILGEFLDRTRDKQEKSNLPMPSESVGRPVETGDFVGEQIEDVFLKSKRYLNIQDVYPLSKKLESLLNAADRPVIMRVDWIKAFEFCERYGLGMFHVACAIGIFLLMEKSREGLTTKLFEARDRVYRTNIIQTLRHPFISRLADAFLDMPGLIIGQTGTMKDFYEKALERDDIRFILEALFTDLLVKKNEYFYSRNISKERLEQKKKFNGVLGRYLQEWSGVRILIREGVRGVDLSCVFVEWLLTLLAGGQFGARDKTFPVDRLKTINEAVEKYEEIVGASKTAARRKGKSRSPKKTEKKLEKLNWENVGEASRRKIVEGKTEFGFYVVLANEVYRMLSHGELPAEERHIFLEVIEDFLRKYERLKEMLDEMAAESDRCQENRYAFVPVPALMVFIGVVLLMRRMSSGRTPGVRGVDETGGAQKLRSLPLPAGPAADIALAAWGVLRRVGRVFAGRAGRREGFVIAGSALVALVLSRLGVPLPWGLILVPAALAFGAEDGVPLDGHSLPEDVIRAAARGLGRRKETVGTMIRSFREAGLHDLAAEGDERKKFFGLLKIAVTSAKDSAVSLCHEKLYIFGHALGLETYIVEMSSSPAARDFERFGVLARVDGAYWLIDVNNGGTAFAAGPFEARTEDGGVIRLEQPREGEAGSLYSRARVLEPEALAALRHRLAGDRLRADGYYSSAITVYENGLKRRPADRTLIVRLAETHYWLAEQAMGSGEPGRLERALGYCEEALPYYRDALLLDPDDWAACNGLGRAHKMIGDIRSLSTVWNDHERGVLHYEQALFLYKQALSLTPRDDAFAKSTASYNAGVACELTHRYQKALDYYKSAAKIDAENPLPRVGLGRVYFTLKEWDKAVEVYGEVLGRFGRDEQREKLIRDEKVMDRMCLACLVQARRAMGPYQITFEEDENVGNSALRLKALTEGGGYLVRACLAQVLYYFGENISPDLDPDRRENRKILRGLSHLLPVVEDKMAEDEKLLLKKMLDERFVGETNWRLNALTAFDLLRVARAWVCALLRILRRPLRWAAMTAGLGVLAVLAFLLVPSALFAGGAEGVAMGPQTLPFWVHLVIILSAPFVAAFAVAGVVYPLRNAYLINKWGRLFGIGLCGRVSRMKTALWKGMFDFEDREIKDLLNALVIAGIIAFFEIFISGRNDDAPVVGLFLSAFVLLRFFNKEEMEAFGSEGSDSLYIMDIGEGQIEFLRKQHDGQTFLLVLLVKDTEEQRLFRMEYYLNKDGKTLTLYAPSREEGAGLAEQEMRAVFAKVFSFFRQYARHNQRPARYKDDLYQDYAVFVQNSPDLPFLPEVLDEVFAKDRKMIGDEEQDSFRTYVKGREGEAVRFFHVDISAPPPSSEEVNLRAGLGEWALAAWKGVKKLAGKMR